MIDKIIFIIVLMIIACSGWIYSLYINKRWSKDNVEVKTYPIPKTYDDIFAEFLHTKWNDAKNEILDWRPAEDVCSIRIWTKAGPVYIYDCLSHKLILEIQRPGMNEGSDY